MLFFAQVAVDTRHLDHIAFADGSGGAIAFTTVANLNGLSIVKSATFVSSETDFRAAYQVLRQSSLRVIILICHGNVAGRFMRGALEEGVGGEGFLYFGSSSLANVPALLDGDAKLAANNVLRLRVLKGFVVLQGHIDEQSTAYSQYRARNALLGSTTGGGAGCNAEQDDDGEE